MTLRQKELTQIEFNWVAVSQTAHSPAGSHTTSAIMTPPSVATELRSLETVFITPKTPFLCKNHLSQHLAEPRRFERKGPEWMSRARVMKKNLCALTVPLKEAAIFLLADGISAVRERKLLDLWAICLLGASVQALTSFAPAYVSPHKSWLLSSSAQLTIKQSLGSCYWCLREISTNLEPCLPVAKAVGWKGRQAGPLFYSSTLGKLKDFFSLSPWREAFRVLSGSKASVRKKQNSLGSSEVGITMEGGTRHLPTTGCQENDLSRMEKCGKIQCGLINIWNALNLQPRANYVPFCISLCKPQAYNWRLLPDLLPIKGHRRKVLWRPHNPSSVQGNRSNNSCNSLRSCWLSVLLLPKR